MVGDQQQRLPLAAHFHQAHPHGAQLLGGSQMNPTVPHHPRLRGGRADRKLLFPMDHRTVLEPEKEKRPHPVNHLEKPVALAVEAIGHIGLSRHQHLTQRLCFAAFADGQERVLRAVFGNIKTQMQPHSFGLPLAAHPVFGPGHPRQGRPEAAILRDELQMLEPPIARVLPGHPLHQLFEHLLEQVRLQQPLGFGKTSQTDFAAAGGLLDFL